MDFDAVADELYGLVPEEFTAAREGHVRQARADGDRELANSIKHLRRPTASAWLVNLLSRHEGERIDELLELGQGLREAQETLSGPQLRQLSAQRHRVIRALASRARQLAAQAGHRASSDTQRQVETTLEAALADPQAAEAVISGRLTRSLEYAGFGTVDTRAAVAGAPRKRATPGKDTELDRRRERRAERDRARETLQRAEHDARAAEQEVTDRERETSAAADRCGAAAGTVQRLQRELDQAREEQATAEQAADTAGQELDRARQAADRARQRAGEARAALDRL